MSVGKVYYAVAYCRDGTIHLWPGGSREECEVKLWSILRDRRCHDRIRRTTIIKRDAAGVGEEGYAFGCPESLNVLAKFDRALEKGKEAFSR